MRRQRRRAEQPEEILLQASPELDEQGVNSEPVDGRSVCVLTHIRSDVDDSPVIQKVNQIKYVLDWQPGPVSLAYLSRRTMFVEKLQAYGDKFVDAFALADRYFKHQKVFPFSITAEGEEIVDIEFDANFAGSFEIEAINSHIRAGVLTSMTSGSTLYFSKVIDKLGFSTRFRDYRSAATKIPNVICDRSKYFCGGIVKSDAEDFRIFSLEQLLKMLHVIASMFRSLDYFQTIVLQYDKLKLSKEVWYDMIDFDKSNPHYGDFISVNVPEEWLRDRFVQIFTLYVDIATIVIEAYDLQGKIPMFKSY